MARWKRIFLAVSLALFVFDAAFVGLNYLSARDAMRASLREQGKEALHAFHIASDLSQKNMLQLATLVAGDSEVQELFRRGAQAVEEEGGGEGGEQAARFRRALYDKLQNSWASLNKAFGFRQLHFHLPPGSTSFLRVHKPAKFGDPMHDTRHTVVHVNEAREPVTGFETGRVYSGLRGVVPVYAPVPDGSGRTFVGALEAGVSFEKVLANVHERVGAEIAVLLNKDHVEDNMWPNAIESLFGSDQPIGGFYLEAATSDRVASRLRRIVAGLPEEQGTVRLFSGLWNGAAAATQAPLYDYRTRTREGAGPVGRVVVIQDAEEAMAELHRNLRRNAIYGGVTFLVVELLLFFGIRRLSAHLEGRIRQRTAQLEEAQRVGNLGSWVWYLDAGAMWWSRQVYRIFGYAPETFWPDKETFVGLTHPKDRHKLKAFLDQARAGDAPDPLDHRIVTRDGSIRHVRERVELQRDAEGTPLRMMATIQDITEQRQLEEALAHQAHHDQLTGLYNRYAFEEVLVREKERAIRHEAAFAVVMLDIDHFKAINDSEGHVAGDEVLKTLAELLGGRLRSSDVLARWGGEEFIVLLPETGWSGGLRVAEDLRASVAAARFPVAREVTVSVGLAVYQTGEAAKELIKRADNALYTAKEGGRNRVVSAGREES